MKYLAALFTALALNACANLLMKVGMQSVAGDGGILRNGFVGAIKTVLTSRALMIGLICFGLNAAFYMYALQSKSLKISIAYPIMVGGGFALIAVIAYIHPVLQERLTLMQKFGVGLVLLGIVLIATQMDSSAKSEPTPVDGQQPVSMES